VYLFLAALLLILCSGLASLSSRGERIGVWGGMAGCTAALLPALRALLGGPLESVRIPWAVPGGSFYVSIDALSGLFLVPILGLSILGYVYGAGYMSGKRPATHWFFYSLLVCGMAIVVVARNAMLFLVAWEVMALASYFLVVTDDEKESVREAGWTYLVATHLGTAFLFGLFALLGRHAGSLDFDRFEALAGLPSGVCALAFVLAVVGFGTKAGFMPFHVWLPEAHPAAPSHVSALMSGVMIKTGIYGLVRTLTFLGAPPAWWGWALVGIGIVCGVGGALFALAQRDLKRILAYSSVENIGIITLGLGIGLLGLTAELPVVAALGFAGALLHVINHAVFKGLLFLAAGSVLHATGTVEIERLGGLLKRMPRTGIAFFIGAVAITGLPPLNGFVGEYLLFVASFQGAASTMARVVVPLGGALAGLALISGLAAACFARAFGMVFLGQPRSEQATHAHESGPSMLAPQSILAALCVVMGLMAPFMFRLVAPAVAVVTRQPVPVNATVPGLTGIMLTCALLIAALGILDWVRWRLLANREVGETGTWDCGYAAPTARMQYTSSSFAQPLTDLFRTVLRTRAIVKPPVGFFPAPGSLATETPDACREDLYRPVFMGIGRVLGCLRRVQHGNLRIYVLYIAVTLLALLVWRLG
jgi:formate hydrogenlyase subunit 3/multisubunit Na+/H+ antiporter MnhD subunit